MVDILKLGPNAPPHTQTLFFLMKHFSLDELGLFMQRVMYNQNLQLTFINIYNGFSNKWQKAFLGDYPSNFFV